ncbi:expressed unknown protein [Seminavis robusta]|uniref:Uncharacterized protein n=1 Tax=Seminavis robusta TaxID=568900 RepID=A0A9N8ERC5_9STRA|nr:expressed unknown protein [Seminavis robusta]|eukprot:Sro1447_g273530.1 n/a (399) ;mRNA; r:1613-2809
MPRLDIQYEHDVGYEREFVYLDDLQGLSPLHSLVVTGAPLAMVRLVYQADPAAMTDDIFLDACYQSPSKDVVEFLKGHVVDPSVLEPKSIAEIMRDTLEERQLTQFETLFVLFPEALMYSENPEKISSSFTEAFTVQARTGDIGYVFLSKMIQYLPLSSKRIHVSLEWDTNYSETEEARSALASKVRDMTNLNFLTLAINVGDDIDCNMVKAISYQIASGPLQSLEIDSWDSETCAENGLFLPLLDALAGAGDASKLKEFKLHITSSTDTGRDYAKTYQDRMIDILQWNTTLTNVNMVRYHDIIGYHTTLNRYGRHLLRDTEKSLDTAQLLTSVIAGVFTPQGVHWTQQVPVLYGLLREAPDKWSSPRTGKSNNAAKEKKLSLKRKASSSLDRSSFKG